MEVLIPSEEDCYQAKLELLNYSDSVGELGAATTKMGRNNLLPHDWWIINGGIDVPNLQRFTIRVLSQTCSASPCERNWSSFNHIHSKKRNRFLQQKLNDCVFIQYNKKLQRRYDLDHKYKRGAAKKPIFLEEIDEDDEWLDPANVDELYTIGADVLTLEQVRDVMGVNSGPVTRSAASSAMRPSEEVVNEDDDNWDYDDGLNGHGGAGFEPVEDNDDEFEFEFDIE